MKKYFAFTLAEVLVTLGIIGVISAMTMPTLVNNHQRQVFVTQLQKVVTELSQAAEKATNDGNATSLAETRYNENHANCASDFLNTYFKVIQECATSPWTPCLASEYKYLDGATFNSWQLGSSNSTCVSIASGATICMNGGVDGDSYEDGRYTYHGYTGLFVDVNGPQGPNILGRDLFYMELYSDGKIAESYEPDTKEGLCGNSSTAYEYGVGCLSRIMADGWKMDY